MSDVETPVAEQRQVNPNHPAARRDRIKQTRARFSHVPVRQGTQQSGLILDITNEFGALAEIVETKCHDSREKSTALTLLLQAKMMAIHAVTHRGEG